MSRFWTWWWSDLFTLKLLKSINLMHYVPCSMVCLHFITSNDLTFAYLVPIIEKGFNDIAIFQQQWSYDHYSFLLKKHISSWEANSDVVSRLQNVLLKANDTLGLTQGFKSPFILLVEALKLQNKPQHVFSLKEIYILNCLSEC